MYTEEMFGHIEGMLNRDLRTTKTTTTTLGISVRTENQCRVDSSTLAECRGGSVGVSHVFPRKNKRFQQRRNSYVWNSLQRFKHILIFGIYFLSIFNLPTSLSSPVPTPPPVNMEREWWIHPTDMGNTNSTSKCNLVKLMCDMVKIMKNSANVYLNTHLLPIPGEITWNVPDFFPIKDDQVDSSQFENMDINEFTKDIYNDLQKYALGLDIMYRFQLDNSDTEAGNTKFQTLTVIGHLKAFLFEVNDYFNAFSIIKKDDVRENDFAIADMDVTTFTKFSNVLVKQFVNNVVFVQAGLNYYNETECN